METTAITTKSFYSPSLGDIEYEEEQVVIFPSGLIGFEELVSFVLYEREEMRPFVCMVSIEEPAIYFPLLDPRIIDQEYGSENLLSELKSLGITRPNDAFLFCIVTIGKDISQVTVNLRGPLIINPKRMVGRQIILIDSKYMVQHPLSLL